MIGWIILSILIVWFLCGLLAAYKLIKYDPEENKKEVQDGVIEYLMYCILTISLGCISLLMVYIEYGDGFTTLSNFFIKIIDKIGGIKDE